MLPRFHVFLTNPLSMQFASRRHIYESCWFPLNGLAVSLKENSWTAKKCLRGTRANCSCILSSRQRETMASSNIFLDEWEFVPRDFSLFEYYLSSEYASAKPGRSKFGWKNNYTKVSIFCIIQWHSWRKSSAAFPSHAEK